MRTCFEVSGPFVIFLAYAVLRALSHLIKVNVLRMCALGISGGGRQKWFNLFANYVMEAAKLLYVLHSDA